MIIVDYPLLPPGKCVNCGYGGRERRYADTQLDLEFYGIVYLCELCIADWAGKFGLGDVSSLRERVDYLSRRIGELEDERDSLLATIRALEPSRSIPANQPDLFSSNDSELKPRERPLSSKSS